MIGLAGHYTLGSEDRTSVVHGDFKPDNVILSKGSSPQVVRAVYCIGFYRTRKEHLETSKVSFYCALLSDPETIEVSMVQIRSVVLGHSGFNLRIYNFEENRKRSIAGGAWAKMRVVEVEMWG